MKSDDYDALPLIYSCSGCSNIAQLANSVAIELDREVKAEMSCIAGVGGGVKAAGEARPGLVRDERRRGKAVRQERVHIAGELRIVHVVRATRETYSGAQVGAVSSRV